MPEPVDDPASTDPARLLTVSVERTGDAAIVVAAGEIDLATIPQLETAISTVFTNPPPLLVLDFADVRFCASNGLSLLVETHQEAGPGTTVRVVIDNPSVLRAITVTGLEQTLDIRSTRDDALRAPGTAPS
ncbi:STAS domain-containing protein [Amycolatopsis sp. NPDC059657]|uniref:STAS domain-containing protein n=1 Tax=Amycolatopsis sp. NPDC059657 TaxID=3346899 RepID=UPI00366C4069